jgi:UDP-glucose:(heptosyl)LPS alpha-1,3-glucosyltransferase
VSIGFDKTWGQDILYPQGGLHAASAAHNLLKYRSVVVRGAAWLVKQLDLAHRSFAALERRQYLQPNRPIIIVNSEMVRRHFQHYYGIPPEVVRVIRSAVDPGRFAAPDRPRLRAHWRREWGIGNDTTVALFVAMNYRLKGLEPLLHAGSLLPSQSPFQLLVVGNARTQTYERLARRLNITDHVLFLGPQRDIQHCYFAADFLVHPTFYDPCSLVVLEALACGMPVITSCYNGASELLHPPREGYVIADPHDHARLANCMIQLFDPARRSACAQAARQTASEWTFDRHYRQLLQLFAEAGRRRQVA